MLGILVSKDAEFNIDKKKYINIPVWQNSPKKSYLLPDKYTRSLCIVANLYPEIAFLGAIWVQEKLYIF
jgi:hypothetical protein